MREIVVTRVAPAFEGTAFGAAGAYESVEGRIVGALDPAHPRNRGIVDLDKAPRGPDGLVSYDVDFYILRPADPTRGNGWIFYEVLNRGAKRVLERINGGTALNVTDKASDASNGFLMREGYTIVWSGWQGELAAAPNSMNARFPVATDGGRPITGRAMEEFIGDQDGPSFVGPLTYPAATLDPADAVLTARRRERDPRQTPSGLSWRYLDERRIEIVKPAGGEFDKGTIYEFVYTAKDPIVSGIAFASVRDFLSWLRHGTADEKGNPNPLHRGGTNPIRRAMMFGLSQSGRFARDFLYQGFNRDLGGRPVFEAATPLIAGSRKTFVNARFAQPGRYPRQHEDHNYPGDQFPFTYTPLTDPISDRTDDVLSQCRADGFVPKIMHFDSDSEVWQARSSLVATDCEGRDVAMPEEVRLYLAAGLQHGTAARENLEKGSGPTNPVGYGALMRPLIRALARWVDEGVPPPPSRFPAVADGSFVTLEQGRAGFPGIPGVHYPECPNGLRLMDHSSVPPKEGPAYPVFVARTDPDGNADAGIRHPLLDAPIATHTGWNVRSPEHGGPGELAGVLGSLIPFAETKAERERTGDPRPSIEERYGSRAGWITALRAACDRLILDGFLLPEDKDRLLAAAESGGDVFTAI